METPPDSDVASHEEIKSLMIDSTEEEPKTSSEEPKPAPAESDQSKSQASTSRNSPDPCCAICLEPLQNKSFTNSCLHMFCFKCLVEWSKIKPECPLCKQQFKSIIHNVQEDFQYDTYYIKNRSTESFWNFTAPSRGISSLQLSINTTFSNPTRISSASEVVPRFRYPTTMTSARMLSEETAARVRNIRSEALQMLFQNHRRSFAPHSVSVPSFQTTSTSVSPFRRNIYQLNMWVKPASGKRFRDTSPEFYRQYPACTHRLLPWLNRELRALLQNFESELVCVLELIMSLITRYEIMSQQFFDQIQPYLRDSTGHFVHEFFHFASSPHDMETYDRVATYEPYPQSRISSLRSDVPEEIITLDNEDSSEYSASVSNSSHVKKKSKRQKTSGKQEHIIKMVMRRNRDTGSWVRLPTFGLNFSNPGPSTSGISSNLDVFERPLTPLSERVNLISPVRTDSSDDEIKIVDVIKPKSERTPEIIDLSSDEEISNTVIDVSSGDNLSDAEETDNSMAIALSPDLSPTYTDFDRLSHYSPISPTYSPLSPYSPSSNLLTPPSYSPVTPSNYSPVTHSNYNPVPPPYYSSPISLPFSGASTEYNRRGPSPSSDIECIYESQQQNTSTTNTEAYQQMKTETSFPPISLFQHLYLDPSSLINLSDKTSPVNLSKTKCEPPSNSTDQTTKNTVEVLSFPDLAMSQTASTSSTMHSPDNTIKRSTTPKSLGETESPAAEISNSLSPTRPKLLSKIVIPSAGCSSVWRTPNSNKKSPKRELSASNSDTDSEFVLPPKKKKLKLRSFVAHFSYDNSDDKETTSHRSSHKKRKDKKKKKHNRKHKYRLITDSDSSS